MAHFIADPYCVHVFENACQLLEISLDGSRIREYPLHYYILALTSTKPHSVTVLCTGNCDSTTITSSPDLRAADSIAQACLDNLNQGVEAI